MKLTDLYLFLFIFKVTYLELAHIQWLGKFYYRLSMSSEVKQEALKHLNCKSITLIFLCRVLMSTEGVCGVAMETVYSLHKLPAADGGTKFQKTTMKLHVSRRL